ncbi:translation initiation factor IF-2-like [Bufo gargarizans]|uniref:translation initiation factor IF-2-like n=1 Tax=Bufo gargarizans TaxID=30331 RepID=UPI001CF37F68|nr:translation initiation factor IF-2-like [Bufo gargarizans]
MSAQGMSVEQLLEWLRREAEVRGPGWLQEQVGACGVLPAPVATPLERAARPRRGHPPARLSPESTPRARRRVGSPSADPPRRRAAARPAVSRPRRGRNPTTRRGPERSGTPPPPLPAAVFMDAGPGTVVRPGPSYSGRSTRRQDEFQVLRAAWDGGDSPCRPREDRGGEVEGPLVDTDAAVPARGPSSVVQRVVQVVQEEQPSTSGSYASEVSVRRESGSAAAGVTAPVVPVGAVPASSARSGGGGSGVSAVALGDPGGEVMGLLRDSLSPGTWKEYGKAWTTWEYDILAFVYQTETTLPRIMDLVGSFSVPSGLEINWGKTVLLPIDELRDCSNWLALVDKVKNYERILYKQRGSYLKWGKLWEDWDMVK